MSLLILFGFHIMHPNPIQLPVPLYLPLTPVSSPDKQIKNKISKKDHFAPPSFPPLHHLFIVPQQQWELLRVMQCTLCSVSPTNTCSLRWVML